VFTLCKACLCLSGDRKRNRSPDTTSEWRRRRCNSTQWKGSVFRRSSGPKRRSGRRHSRKHCVWETTPRPLKRYFLNQSINQYLYSAPLDVLEPETLQVEVFTHGDEELWYGSEVKDFCCSNVVRTTVQHAYGLHPRPHNYVLPQGQQKLHTPPSV